ncbi:TPR-like protein [Dioscorea alata]|uniref:TPR-like protein n=1 Tax=Dioscorea alata TaxID=55571 RepID=A0ACB7VPA0_DIOAL|nr:TPR-like protein [Dioscorea alata]
MSSLHGSMHQRLLQLTKLLTSYVNQGRHNQALTLFSQMFANPDLTLDPFAFPLALKSCAALHLPSTVAAIHSHSLKSNLLPNPFVASALVDSYGKSDSIVHARQLFDECPQRNVVVWNAMISLYSHSNDVASALRLFDMMDVPPTVSSYNCVIAALAESEGGSSRALELYGRMRASGMAPNLITVLALLPACVGVGALSSIKEIHGFTFRNNIHKHVQVGSGIVEAYGRCGCLVNARRVFDLMPQRDVVVWSSMVSSYAFHGQADIAMLTLKQMESDNVRPDWIMLLGVLKACSHAGLTDDALHFFDLMTKHYGIQACSEHYSCLVDVLSRAGRLRDAYDVIQGMPMKATPKAWGALLAACRNYGEVELAEIASQALFEIEPDNSGNFLLLANSYAGAGRYEEAEKVRREMIERGVNRRGPGSSWVISQ